MQSHCGLVGYDNM